MKFANTETWGLPIAILDDNENLDGNGKDEDWKRKSSNGEKQVRRESRMRSKGLKIISNTKWIFNLHNC